MASIDRLNQSSIAAADSLPFSSATAGADRRTSVTQLAAVLQPLLTAVGGLIQQSSSPNATGFAVTVTPLTDGAWVWLLLTPLAGYAAGTVTLPASPGDLQEVLVTCTQAVTVLTVAGNGKTVNGAPTTLAANGYFRLKYAATSASWYRTV